MKFVLPLGAITFGASFCCCCGDTLTPIFQELGLPADMLGETATTSEPVATTTTETTATTTTTTTTVPVATPGTVSTSICGPFVEQKLGPPGGFTVVSCAESAGTASILFTGTTPPKAVCNPMRDWASSAGWNLQNEASTSDTVALTFTQRNERLTIACSSATGSTTVSATISPA